MSIKIRVSILAKSFLILKTTRKRAQGPSHYIILSYCAFPSPETFAACQVRPFIFLFGKMAKHFGSCGPKHRALMTYLYMLVSNKIISFLFRFPWKWDFTTPPHPQMHARYKVYVSRLLLRSYYFQWRWWCTVTLPSVMVHLLSFSPNWMY